MVIIAFKTMCLFIRIGQELMNKFPELVTVPRSIYTGKKVLVMDYLEGVNLSNLAGFKVIIF